MKNTILAGIVMVVFSSGMSGCGNNQSTRDFGLEDTTKVSRLQDCLYGTSWTAGFSGNSVQMHHYLQSSRTVFKSYSDGSVQTAYLAIFLYPTGYYEAMYREYREWIVNGVTQNWQRTHLNWVRGTWHPGGVGAADAADITLSVLGEVTPMTNFKGELSGRVLLPKSLNTLGLEGQWVDVTYVQTTYDPRLNP